MIKKKIVVLVMAVCLIVLGGVGFKEYRRANELSKANKALSDEIIDLKESIIEVGEASTEQVETDEKPLDNNENKVIKGEAVNEDREKDYELINKIEVGNNSVELYIDAERYEDGFALDDSHFWLLYVRDEEKDYVLYEGEVRGRLDVHVYQIYDDDDMQLGLTTVQKQTAGMEIAQYIKDENEGVIIEEGKLEVIGINPLGELGLQ